MRHKFDPAKINAAHPLLIAEYVLMLLELFLFLLAIDGVCDCSTLCSAFGVMIFRLIVVDVVAGSVVVAVVTIVAFDAISFHMITCSDRKLEKNQLTASE